MMPPSIKTDYMHIIAKEIKKIKILLSCIVITLLLMSFVKQGSASNKNILTFSAPDYSTLLNEIDFNAIVKHTKFLSSLNTRVTGYGEFYTAARYIQEKFREYGLNVTLHYFNVTVPVDYGASIRIYEHPELKLRVFSFEPNFIIPNIAINLSGPLVYVGEGSFEELEGKVLNGSILLMDFNSHGIEKLLRAFGVKAIIYIEPDETTVDEIRGKRYELPIHFPRYLMPKDDALKLLSLLEKGERIHVMLNSYMRWEIRKGINIIGSIKGTEHPEAIRVLCTYFDSYSIIPSHAPGANEATSVAVLLELARLMVKHRPSYTTYFIAFSGHYQGVAGAREFVEEVIWNRTVPSVNMPGQKFDKSNFLNITRVIEIALTTRSDEWAITNIGDLNGHVTSPQSPVTYGNAYLYDYILLIAREVGEKLGHEYKILNAHTVPGAAAVGTAAQAVVAVVPPMRVMCKGFLPFDFEPFAYDSIAMSIGFFTVDPMHHSLSPIDTFEKLNWENLRRQLESMIPVIYDLVATDNFTEYLKSIGRYSPPQKPVYIYRRGATLTGRVAIYDKKIAWYRPIPNALVAVYHIDTFGARWQVIDKIVTMTDSKGRFEIHHLMGGGMSDSYNIYAFKLDNKTGRIVYAFDMGRYAYAPLKTYWIKKFYEDCGFVTVFKAASIVLYDFVDPEVAGTAGITRGIEVLDAISDATSESYGYMMDGGQAVIFVPTEYPVKIILKAAHLGRIPLGVLLNSTDENPTGYGYLLKPGMQYDIFFTPLRIAKDFLYLIDKYYSELATYGIESVKAEEIKNMWSMMYRISEDYKLGRYSHAYIEALRLWGKALKAYSNLISTKNDIVSTVPVFAFMLIAFVPLFQQLVFPSHGKTRITILIAIFSVFMIALYIAHPGFRLASNALMTIIGALISVSIIPSFAILYSALTWSIKMLMKKVRGMHEVEKATTGAVALGLPMGIENLRKYKLRTILVMLTVTPIVLSNVMLTSLSYVEVIRYVGVPKIPPYNGVLIRQQEWRLPLDKYFAEALIHSLKGGELVVAPRTVLYTIAPALPPELRLSYRVSRGERYYEVYAMVGMHPDAIPEDTLKRIIVKGRWFRAGDRWKCVLTVRQANALDVKELPAFVYFLGKRFEVIGIINSTEFNRFVDINSEQLTPWDARIPEQDFVHASADEVLMIDYRTSLYFNPTYSAITIRTMAPEDALRIGKELYSAFVKLNIWVGASNNTYIVSLGKVAVIYGTSTQTIPIVIAAMILFNVMIGSLYERRRDVYVISTTGASPRDIMIMFLAESLTYAIISGLIGYLIAAYLMRWASQVLAIPVNYASGGVLTAIGVAVLVVISSALYPIRWITRLVTPSLKRRWEMPTRPSDDTWYIPLPFRYPTRHEIHGVCAYLLEFLHAHEGENVPIFAARDIKLKTFEEGAEINFTCRIAPYELGVLQDVEIAFIKPKDVAGWTTSIKLLRRAGPRDSWERLNVKFVDEIRKQLLLWRALPTDEKDKYCRMFERR